MAFLRNFPSNEIYVNFQGTYCFIPPELLNDNLRWMLTSHKLLRESSLFSIVSRKISEENSLWLLCVLIQTKQIVVVLKRRRECLKLGLSSRSTIISFLPVKGLIFNASEQLKTSEFQYKLAALAT